MRTLTDWLAAIAAAAIASGAVAGPDVAGAVGAAGTAYKSYGDRNGYRDRVRRPLVSVVLFAEGGSAVAGSVCSRSIGG